METSKAYDLPVRIFHWAFAILFVLSFSIAKFIDDESILYIYHMLSGIMMVFLVILRVIWGFAGSSTSRFSSFRLNPIDLLSYITSLFSTHSKRYLGHNPASSYAAVLMMAFTIGIGLSGLMMSLSINKDFFEEIHELLAHGLLIVVIFHIAGVILHQARHQDGMIFSMLSGKKAKLNGENEIKSNHTVVALVFAVSIVVMGNYLLRNLDSNTGKLSLFGSQLQLGENENDNEEENEEEDDD
jgi:cytochrome b